MNKEEKLKLYDRVLKLGSIEHQDNKLIEELSEQITELVRVQTHRNQPNSKEVITELADSIIMLEQYSKNHFNVDLYDYNLENNFQFKNIIFYSAVVIENIIKRIEYKPNIDILYSYIMCHIRKLNLISLVELAIDCKLKRLEKRVLDGGILEKQ